jgi:hypothetical protein
MITQARHNVMLYIHCLSCFISHPSLFQTPGVAIEGYWPNLGRGCKTLKNLFCELRPYSLSAVVDVFTNVSV